MAKELLGPEELPLDEEEDYEDGEEGAEEEIDPESESKRKIGEKYLLKEAQTLRAFDAMKKAHKDTDEYQQAREKWVELKAQLSKIWGQLPPAFQEDFMEFSREETLKEADAILEDRGGVVDEEDIQPEPSVEPTPAVGTPKVELPPAMEQKKEQEVPKSLKIDKNHPDFYKPWKLNPKEMTVEEIQLQIQRAVRSAFVPGITDLGASYWEKQLKDAKTRGADSPRTIIRVEETRKEEAKDAAEAEEIKSQVEASTANISESQVIEVNMADTAIKAEDNTAEAEQETKKTQWIGEIEGEIKALKKELEGLKDKEYIEKKEAGAIEQAKIEKSYSAKEKAIKKEIRDLEKELRQLEKEGKSLFERFFGGDFKKTTEDSYNKSKAKTDDRRGWIKERLKGSIFGVYEFAQAEKFRRGTKDVGADVEAQARLIHQEEGELSLEESYEEVGQMHKVFKDAQIEVPTAEAYEFLSKTITEKKIDLNQKIEDAIVSDSLEHLEKVLESKTWPLSILEPKKYKNEGGEEVLTPENKKALGQSIREKLRELRRTQANSDLAKYAKIIRQDLDPIWWRRYVYGGVFALIGKFGIPLVLGKELKALPFAFFPRKDV